MSKRSDEIHLKDILLAIEEVEQFTQNVTYEIFLRNRMMQNAVVRDFEVIGEASRRLSDALKSMHTEIPWADIVGMRNKLGHDYFAIDFELLWSAIKHDLPQLKLWIQSVAGKPPKMK